MLAKALLSLGLWLRFAAGQDTPEPGPQPLISNTEGDLLFLLDSSASVSHYEFSKVKEFMWDLLHPFTFGPRDIQASIIHISTTPTMEFPFDQYLSSGTLRKAIRDTRQLMGDTNTGKALSYAKEKLFSGEAGARPDAPKVLVWVTDGFSTDDISEPMQLLKDMGVTVFIVSTGRSNFLELSAAASQPLDKHLHFVDVDDLPIITKELRDGILEEISPVQVLISESGPYSFHVSWAPVLDSVASYQLLYGPLPGNSVKVLEVDGKHNSTVVEHLAPNTTYLVTVTAIYRSGKKKSLSAKACTQEEGSKVKHLRFQDMGPNTLKVSWDSAAGPVLGYRVRCRRHSGPSSVLSVSPQVHSVLLSDLPSGTSGKVCVQPVYRNQPGQRLCRSVHRQPATEAQGYRHRQKA
ncbi:PREDICTED: von Willebrand factor A domain-containing protein 1 isoform X2 [Pseudopodoces humilis]|uniref:von Willebrand factor A domain-containing protein 1 isoform X2 n=1 Tax=Pseudopodoces humilis TaxID=181119 RepID=UPI0006B6AD37|nr:PREDICTED: von Willebrand factor A domain-containing protein 1 isoform X2 [Pseudopodoces humilis]